MDDRCAQTDPRIRDDDGDVCAHAQESRIDELLSSLDAETLAEMLRFLSLELERIVDEQRIQAMKLLVERIRRRREAEESGTRQQEQRRRRADDELFRQVRVVQIDRATRCLARMLSRTRDGRSV